MLKLVIGWVNWFKAKKSSDIGVAGGLFRQDARALVVATVVNSWPSTVPESICESSNKGRQQHPVSRFVAARLG